MAVVRSSMKWVSLWVVLALILSGWVLRTESASSGGTVSADVTAQVKTTFSGLRYNRTTQTYDTVATLTNTSSDPILAPLELHIVGITPATVTLNNASGIAGDGHPYVMVPLPTSQLAPGATVTNVVLRFRNSSNVQFTFTHHLIGMLTVRNTPPVANAGSNQSVPVGATVTLDGNASTDADNNALTYQWTLSQKPQDSTAALNNPAVQKPTFVVDKPGDYVAQLVVSDGIADSAPATVTVTAAIQGATQERLLPLGSYPAGVTLGDTKDVIFTVSLVGAPGVIPTQVTLQALDDTGTVVVSHLGSLHDDGLNGDLGAGDFVYSGIFTIAGEQEGKLLYRAKAEIPGKGEVTSEKYVFEVTPFRVGPQPSDSKRYIKVLNSDLEVVANE